MHSDEIINLLWTGGWDSTYRLLYLLLVKGKPVQPYYLVDVNRKSTFMEFRTMGEIKKRLFDLDSKTKELLKPTIITAAYDLKPNKLIAESFSKIQQPYKWGTQYEWLARFAAEKGLNDLELCAEKGISDRAKYYQSHFVRVNDNDFFEFDKKYIGTDLYIIFGSFRHPVLDLRKDDMLSLSRKYGFNEIMEMTWFCHRPRPNNTPCGICTPCKQLMSKGFGRRIPLMGRVRYRFRIIYSYKEIVANTLLNKN